MNPTIDERVVEMRFDNKQFEQGAGETIGTLKKLRESLNFTKSTESLQDLSKVANNIKLDGMAAGIEALERRFSTLGIVGMRVIENITDGMMNKLHTAVRFASDSIVSGGIKRAMNIENAHFQLQALLKDETKVQAVMNDAMESVDGTAYAYDEAAKAASQFAASGLESGEEMLGALKAITGVAAMTNSEYEGISNIFTTIAGNGRLMGDQLLQLSARGLNAASTISDYFREVRGEADMTEGTIREMVTKGQISFQIFSEAMTWAFGDSAKRANETFNGALSNMKSALARIGAGFISPLVEQNGELVNLFNALRVQINNIKGELVFDEQTSAISGLAKAAKISNDRLTDMFAGIKQNGSVTIANLNQISKRGVNATVALRDYINGVSNGSIRASYATKTALEELTQGMTVNRKRVKQFVEEGKISLDIFTSAMEKSYGDQKALSKQVTDFVLDGISGLVKGIEEADLTKPIEAFYNGIEIGKNGLKGLYSIVKPIGEAFAEVFLSFSGDDVVNFTSAIEKLTEKMKLSEKGSKNLHDAAKGVFDILKLLTDGLFKLLGVSTSTMEPVDSLTELLLRLLGAFGRGLSTFSQWVRGSTAVAKTFHIFAAGFKTVTSGVKWFIEVIDSVITHVKELEIVIDAVDGFKDGAKDLAKTANESLDAIIPQLKEFKDELKKEIPKKAMEMYLDLSKWLKDISNIKIGNPLEAINASFDMLYATISKFMNYLRGNESFDTYLTNAETFAHRLGDAFSIEGVSGKIDAFIKLMKFLGSVMKDTLGPLFTDFGISGVVGTAGGFGVIYTIIKITKSLDKVSNSLSAIPNLLGGIQGTLVAYQKELKAEKLKEIAKAILIFAAAITILSFADMKNAWEAAVMLGLFGSMLMLAAGSVLQAVNRGKTANDALFQFAKGLKKSMSNFAKAAKWKAIGSMFASVGSAILKIAASIVVLGLLYRKDPQAIEAGGKLVAMIAGVLVGIIAFGSILGSISKEGTKNFGKASIGVVALCFSLQIIIGALQKLFKMEFPTDWKKRFKILSTILLELGALTIVMGIASRIGKGKALSAGTFLSFAAMLMVTISALKKLFEMDLPEDYKEKLKILETVFLMMGSMLLVLGATSRIAKGTMKAGTTILALSAFLITTVGALMVLSLLPEEKLMNGAKALGAILLTLGVSLLAASKIATKDSYMVLIGMAINIGAITASLAFLSLVPMEKLRKSVIALGAILLALSVDFSAAGKIVNGKAIAGIGVMAGMLVEIAGILMVLSTQPWDNMLGAAGAMSAVLISFAAAYNIIASSKGIKRAAKKINNFLKMTIAILPLGGALLVLSTQPWDRMVGAATALGIAIDAFASAYMIISASKGIEQAGGKVQNFLRLTTSVLTLGTALAILAYQPWEGMLAAATALGIVINAFASAYMIISASKGIKEAKGKVENFLLLTASVLTLGGALAILSHQPWEGMIPAAIALGLTVNAFAAAFDILSMAKGMDAAYGKIGSFLLLTLAVIPLGAALAVLANQPWEGMIPAATALSELLLAFTVCFGVLSLIHANLATGIAAAAGLDAFIVIVGGLMLGIGAIFQNWNDGADMIDTGIEILHKIGQGIGEFIGGIGESVTSSMPAIGENISAFWNALSPFLTGMSSIPDNTFDNIGSLALALIGFTSAKLIDGIGNLFDSDLPGFGKQLSKFMLNALPFFASLRVIDGTLLQTAKALAGVIIALTVSDMVSGIGNFLGMSSGNIEDFGEQLSALGDGLVGFAETTKGLDDKAIKNAAAAAEIIVALAQEIPNSGGLLGMIVGNNDIDDFGSKLPAFGIYLDAFARNVQNLDGEAVENAVRAAEMVTALATNIPNSGGLWGMIAGNNDIDEFGYRLPAFGIYLSSFAKNTKDITKDSVAGAVGAAEILVALAQEIPNSGGMISWLTGDNDIGDFGEKIRALGGGLSSFWNYTHEIDPDKIIGIMDAFSKLGEFSKSLKDSDMEKVTDTLKSFSAIAAAGLSEFAQAFTTSTSRVKSVAETLATKSAIAIKDKGTTFGDAAYACVRYWIAGINDKLENSKTAGEKISNSALDGVRGVIFLFRMAGSDAGIGFILGLNSKIEDAKKAGTKLGEETYKATQKALDEHSPSKKMYQVGDYAGAGYINALMHYVTKAAMAGKSMGSETVKGLTSSVSTISDMINDMDTEFTVSPIVDLSNVRKSTMDISRMFNAAIKTTKFEAMEADISVRKTKEKESGLVSEIAKLRKDLKEKSNTGDTYTINGLSYKEDSDVAGAIQTLIRATKIKGRV